MLEKEGIRELSPELYDVEIWNVHYDLVGKARDDILKTLDPEAPVEHVKETPWLIFFSLDLKNEKGRSDASAWT